MLVRSPTLHTLLHLHPITPTPRPPPLFSGRARQLDLRPRAQAPRAARPDQRRQEVPRPARQGPPQQQGAPLAPRRLAPAQPHLAAPLPLEVRGLGVWGKGRVRRGQGAGVLVEAGSAGRGAPGAATPTCAGHEPDAPHPCCRAGAARAAVVARATRRAWTQLLLLLHALLCLGTAACNTPPDTCWQRAF